METMETNELLWQGRAPIRHGPKPVLTVGRITEIAVGIADEQGLGAVSMQAVADAAGFTKMSLYRHVKGKDELVAVMIERAVGDPPAVSPSQGWRSGVERWAERLAEEWRAHPWLPYATIGHRPIGPRETSWSECVLQSLRKLRLSPTERADVAFLLFGHLRNTHSLQTAGTQTWNEPGHRRFLLERPDEFPALLEVTATPPTDDLGRSFCLSLILDGIQTLHDTRGDGEH
jgi:AcrR family transcriptional regulator